MLTTYLESHNLHVTIALLKDSLPDLNDFGMIDINDFAQNMKHLEIYPAVKHFCKVI